MSDLRTTARALLDAHDSCGQVAGNWEDLRAALDVQPAEAPASDLAERAREAADEHEREWGTAAELSGLLRECAAALSHPVAKDAPAQPPHNDEALDFNQYGLRANDGVQRYAESVAAPLQEEIRALTTQRDIARAELKRQRTYAEKPGGLRPSGCGCHITDADEIVFWCGLHGEIRERCEKAEKALAEARRVPPDAELDALTNNLRLTGGHDCTWAADAITRLRAQLAEAQADRDALKSIIGEAEQLIESSGQMMCRNGVLHDRLDGCLYCQRDALARFKEYVHSRLDEAGVPVDPEDSPHRSAGCRIGGRLDFLIGQLAEARKDADRLKFVSRMMDGIGDTDLHEEASICASVFGRDDPSDDDYLSAVRTAIDAARAKAARACAALAKEQP